MNFFKKFFQKKPKVVRTDVTKRFDLVGRVGQGSMSKVWRANDTATGRQVAVKVLDKFKTARFEARFFGLNKPTEGEIAVQLKHKHVVNTLEWGTTIDDEQFLVMELVEGVSLSFLVDMQNEAMQKNRLSMILQLGEGIKYFHEAGWIHRDICPRNVVVDSDGVVKLIDFGIVVPNTPTFQKPGNRTGTASYMAPELIKRQKTDQRIDIFAYAVTCFEMFTKKHPWDTGETLEAVLQAINQPPKDIRGLAPGIDEQIAETVMKGLKKHPDDRWQTIEEMMLPIREARQRLKQKAALKRRKRKPDAS
jgi:serine/threonine protein kinase